MSAHLLTKKQDIDEPETDSTTLVLIYSLSGTLFYVHLMNPPKKSFLFQLQLLRSGLSTQQLKSSFTLNRAFLRKNPSNAITTLRSIKKIDWF